MSRTINKHDSEFLFFNGLVCAGRFRADRQHTREEQGVREGEWFWITRKALDGSDSVKDYRVKVEFVHPRYVVLRYPAGFCESAHWDDFQRMLN